MFVYNLDTIYCVFSLTGYHIYGIIQLFSGRETAPETSRFSFPQSWSHGLMVRGHLPSPSRHPFASFRQRYLGYCTALRVVRPIRRGTPKPYHEEFYPLRAAWTCDFTGINSNRNCVEWRRRLRHWRSTYLLRQPSMRKPPRGRWWATQQYCG